jgi:hypothetical protein
MMTARPPKSASVSPPLDAPSSNGGFFYLIQFAALHNLTRKPVAVFRAAVSWQPRLLIGFHLDVLFVDHLRE